MSFSFRSVILFCKKLRRIPSLKDNEKSIKTFFSYKQAPLYSTAVSKQIFNVFEVLTDLLTFSYNYNAVQSEPVSTMKYIEPPSIKKHRIDDVIANIDVSSLHLSAKILTNELYGGIKTQDWRCVVKILQFFLDKKVDLSPSVMMKYADEFCNAGFVVGIEYLILLMNVTEPDEILRSKVLLIFAKSLWNTGNVGRCLSTLEECKKYPSLIDDSKRMMRIMIHESVCNRTDGVLMSISNFVRQFTRENNDYYLLTILWYELFNSEWFSHQELSNELFSEFEHLSVCLTMLSPSLMKHYLRNRRENDVHRLLHLLLGQKLLKPYTDATRLLFDHYFARGNKIRCAEIVKSSVVLNAPLHEEQYQEFISWIVSGNPYKYSELTKK